MSRIQLFTTVILSLKYTGISTLIIQSSLIFCLIIYLENYSQILRQERQNISILLLLRMNIILFHLTNFLLFFEFLFILGFFVFFSIL